MKVDGLMDNTCNMCAMLTANVSEPGRQGRVRELGGGGGGGFFFLKFNFQYSFCFSFF